MPKYDITVQVRLEAEDMEFDSKADAEAFGWEMAHNADRYYITVERIQVDEQWEPQKKE